MRRRRKAAASEEHDGDADAFVQIVPSTHQDEVDAARGAVPELDKRLLSDVSDLRIVVNSHSADNTFEGAVEKAGVTAGFIKAQIENQIRRSKTPLRLSDASENILVYDINIASGQRFALKSDLRLLRKITLSSRAAEPQTALATLWERGIEADSFPDSDIKQQVANDAANGARGLVDDMNEAR